MPFVADPVEPEAAAARRPRFVPDEVQPVEVVPPQPKPPQVVTPPKPPGMLSQLRDTTSQFIGDQVDSFRERYNNSEVATSQYIGDYIDEVSAARAKRQAVQGESGNLADGLTRLYGQGEALAQLGSQIPSIAASTLLTSRPDEVGLDPSAEFAQYRERTSFTPRTQYGGALGEELGAYLKPIGDIFGLAGKGAGALGDVLGASPETSNYLRTIVPEVAGVALAPEVKSGFKLPEPLPQPRLTAPPQPAPPLAAPPPPRAPLAGAERARAADYVVVPTEAGGGRVMKSVEGLTGSAKLSRDAVIKNQANTNRLAAIDIGLPENTKRLTDPVLDTAAAPHAAVYKELGDKAGTWEASQEYLADLQSAVPARGLTVEAEANVRKLIAEYSTGALDGKRAVQDTRQLRYEGSKGMRSQDPNTEAIGRAKRAVSDAIEGELERRAVAIGDPTLVERFRDSRRALAKINTIRNSRVGTDVSAKNLAAMAKRGAPLDGRLQLIADVYNDFPNQMRSASTMADKTPVNMTDAAIATAGAALTQNLAGIAAAAVRPIARKGIMSDTYQDSYGQAVPEPLGPNTALGEYFAPRGQRNPTAAPAAAPTGAPAAAPGQAAPAPGPTPPPEAPPLAAPPTAVPPAGPMPAAAPASSGTPLGDVLPPAPAPRAPAKAALAEALTAPALSAADRAEIVAEVKADLAQERKPPAPPELGEALTDQPSPGPSPGPGPKPRGADNTFFTEESAEKARETLRSKLRQANVGLDPEAIQAGLTLAGFHIEAGVRSFAAFSQKMIAELGEAARPYLREWYEAAKAAKPGSLGEALTTAPAPAPRLPAIPRADNLRPAEREIETRFAAQLESDVEGAIRQYSDLKGSEGGRILNTDLARELSADYRADRTRSVAVHEPASWLVKRMYERKLAEAPGKGQDSLVIFSAGGTGAGKSTALEKLAGPTTHRAQIIYDTNMNTLDSAKSRLEQALEAGKRVDIFYVWRDPVEALINGALPRAMRMGRTVPLAEHAKTHEGAAKVVKQLAEQYKDDGRVTVQVIDNSHGKGNATLGSIDAVPDLAYSQLYEQLDTALQAARRSGAISDAVYRATKDTDARGSGARGTQQEDNAGTDRQPQPANPRPALSSLADELTKAAPPAPKAATGPDSPEFREWFGDSKAVDDAGKPKVVYHGTNKEFDAFKTAAGPRSKMVGDWDGAHFTSDRDQALGIARSLARQEGGTPRVVEVYLRAENPAPFGKYRTKQQALDAGHDSRLTENNIGLQEWTVFDPSQIRSATPAQPKPSLDTDTPEFKRFFDDSKAVDDKGKPLKLFHGTRADFTSFDRGKLGAATGAASASKGFFFSNRPQTAESYTNLVLPEEKAAHDALFDEGQRLRKSAFASRSPDPKKRAARMEALAKEGDRMMEEAAEMRRQGGNVMPVYLSLKNPLIHDMKGKRYRDQSYSDLVDKAIAAGHDGLIIKNTHDAVLGDGIADDVYVVFDPKQIKSATGNSGKFDPTVDDIIGRNDSTKARKKRTLADELLDGDEEALA